MGKLTSADIAEIEERLRGMRVALLVTVRGKLSAEHGERTSGLGSLQSGDPGDGASDGEAALGDMLTRADIAMLRQELDELRGIDDALKRIEFGVGGMCIRCGMQIPLARLRAFPAASSCLACAALAR